VSWRYLGDPEEIKRRAAAVRAQGTRSEREGQGSS
jgi:hypothetical protein